MQIIGILEIFLLKGLHKKCMHIESVKKIQLAELNALTLNQQYFSLFQSLLSYSRLLFWPPLDGVYVFRRCV